MHVNNVHSGIRYICPECRSTFSTKDNLARHVKSFHEDKCHEAVGFHESFEHNGDVTNDITTEVEYSDEDNNMRMTIVKQENNSTEKQ